MTTVDGSPAGAYRTTATQVILIAPCIPTTTDLSGYLATAHRLVDRVEECDGGSKLTEEDLELIERWLAAHYWALNNPRLASKGIGGANQSWHQGQLGMGLDATFYGQQALMFDVSGCLQKITADPVSLIWIGDNEDDYDVDWN